MAAPTVQARTTGNTSADAHTYTVTLPGSIAAGERLLAFVSLDKVDQLVIDEDYSGKKWELAKFGSHSTYLSYAVLTKVAEGSDQLRLRMWSHQRGSHVSFRIDAANCVVVSSVATANSTNSDPPNLSLGLGSPTAEVLWIASRHGNGTTVATGAPAGYGNLQTQAGDSANGASTNTAEKTATADSEDPGTFTSASEQWAALTVAVFNHNEGRARVTQQVAEVVSNTDPALRLSQLVVEVVSAGTATPPATTGGMLVIAT
ncbi:MAG TPA: hypothetical protein PKC95_00030 [Thauera aminoaromatica]|nr:hypothetical protein [Thauera aminoaromatica]